MRARSHLPDKAYSCKQSKQIDQRSIQLYGETGLELMYRAGICAFNAMKANYPEARSVVCLAGGGNNAGDAYVVAGLALAEGMECLVLSLSGVETLPDDAAYFANDYKLSGGVIESFDHTLPEADIYIDGLLGSGLDRKVTGRYAQLIKQVNASQLPVIALDLPSGLNGDTGVIMGTAIQASITVCFVALKQGMLTFDGPDSCGKLLFSELNIAKDVYEGEAGLQVRNSCQPVRLNRNLKNTHKGQFGRVLAIGGQPGMGGAILLTAMAALKTGAGLVTLASHKKNRGKANQYPELMSVSVKHGDEFASVASNVIALGPGLGRSDWSRKTYIKACHKITETNAKAVIDADGLYHLRRYKTNIKQLVITPHPGEAAQLMGCSIKDIQQDRIASARALALKYKAVCLLKGQGTIIADRHGSATIVCGGNSALSTAGSGDVLSGIVAGLLAQGVEPYEAAVEGTSLHMASAEKILASHKNGLVASDMINGLADAFEC
ncbi:MAG: NAD(P)H-hydrate dehydratase [bacterium]